MPPAAVNAIPQPQMSKIDTNPAPFSLRDFVVDDDAANFTASLWKSIDQTSFVLAQREALEAFNVAKAMRLSEETAAEENHRRLTAAVSSSASSSASASKSASPSASAAYAAPTITVPIARPESRASDSAKQKSPAMSHHDRKPSSSASAQAFVSRPSPQPRLSLSTHVESSRVTNSVPSSSASHSLRIEQRSLSKREPESPVTKSSMSLASSSASSSTPHSSASASTSTSRTQASDATNSKRRRTERQPSISPNTPSATQQPQQQVLVVPPIIDSQKSTASVHLVNPPPTPVEPRSRRRSTAKSPHSSKPVAEPRDVFMTTRSCTKCGTPVPSPRSQVPTVVSLSNRIILTFYLLSASRGASYQSCPPPPCYMHEMPHDVLPRMLCSCPVQPRARPRFLRFKVYFIHTTANSRQSKRVLWRVYVYRAQLLLHCPRYRHFRGAKCLR